MVSGRNNKNLNEFTTNKGKLLWSPPSAVHRMDTWARELPVQYIYFLYICICIHYVYKVWPCCLLSVYLNDFTWQSKNNVCVVPHSRGISIYLSIYIFQGLSICLIVYPFVCLRNRSVCWLEFKERKYSHPGVKLGSEFFPALSWFLNFLPFFSVYIFFTFVTFISFNSFYFLHFFSFLITYFLTVLEFKK